MSGFGFGEEVDDEGENPMEGQSGTDNSYMVGFITVQIVGLSHYTGTVNGREMVGLVREPTNLHDSNAIKVVNMRGEQVGYLERSVAAVLAPLTDEGLILIEGIVPRAFRNAFKMPCQVYVFTHRDLMSSILLRITQAGLSVITSVDPEFVTAQSIAAKEINEEPVKDERTVDEIFGSLNQSKKRQIMEPSAIVTSPLLQHQKEALAWMIQRENSSEFPPFWEFSDKKGKSQEPLYRNVLTNFQTSERPNPLRGGIFADDMGLGKTLALLSLIATNRPGVLLPPVVDVEPSVKAESISANPDRKDTKRKRGSNRDCSKMGKRKNAQESSSGCGKILQEIVFEPPSPNGPKVTLIVCPPSVIPSWVSQLEEHTKAGSLKVYLYVGERTKESKELCKFDIVLTTYSTLGAELDCSSSPMREIEWLRVILDEAHYIKNHSTKQAKAAIALNAERRWAVTGTPIQNTSFDLYTLMAFLRFQPFSAKSYWNRLIQRPLSGGEESGRSRLRSLMETIALRRTKDMKINGQSVVELPPKFVDIHPVELSLEERELYDSVEAEGKKVVRQYISLGTVLTNYTTVLQIVLRLRQICDNAGLCPPDVKSLVSSLNIEDVSSNPDLLKKLLSILQDGDDFDCPVCLSPPTEAVITSCSHVFCRRCIEKTLEQLKPRCPMCRNQLKLSDLFSSPKDADEVQVNPKKTSGTSSKVNALIALLNESRGRDPTTKSVIFSQFKKMLDLLQEPLENAGFKFVRLDGSMSSKKRSASISAFMSTKPSSPTILLASLKAAGVGINLTAASDVYMFDPWWNPATEDQAMDRVHRIGQRRSVRVIRLIVKDSIEERILTMQERKRMLASSAFNDRSNKEQRQMRVEDVQQLLDIY
eukprot:Gb_13232 [translate_table: standard]